MSYSIGVDGFSSLETSWSELLADSAINHVFSTYQWQRAWWQVFGAGYEMMLLAIRQDGRLAGIAPLKRDKEGISFIGSKDVCDYIDFIARRGNEEEVIASLWEHLDSVDWRRIELHSLLPGSLAMYYFIPLAKKKGYSVDVSQEDVSPELILPSSWEEYLESLNKKDRHELRRKMRRLDKENPHFFTLDSPEQISQSLEEFFRLFKLSAGEKAGFMTEQRKAFFEAIVRNLGEKCYIRLSCLKLGKTRVSYVMWFEYQNQLFLYNSAYDPDYAALNVGLILKVNCLKESIERGMKRFDFLRGDERYKYELGGRDVPVYQCLISRG
jgi:CelD/BcsL family acetyltransferase involved in cellulose biosynthesis